MAKIGLDSLNIEELALLQERCTSWRALQPPDDRTGRRCGV